MNKKKTHKIIALAGMVFLLVLVGIPVFWEKHWGSERIEEEESTALVKQTYTTRYSDIIPCNAPKFQFDFPTNWSITKEEVNDDTSLQQEIVELKNERDVTIRYVCGGRNSGAGRDVMTCEITKIADSNLSLEYVEGVDSSEQGSMVVVKIHNLIYGDVTGRYTETVNKYMYAVVPEAYLSIESYSDCDEWGINRFSFGYGGAQSFIAHSPDGKFTKEEEKEIIEILSSLEEVKN